MAFPESWLNELLNKNDIVSVVSSYVDLKPKGRRLWGLCPVHGEKTPSFSVSPDKQLYYCFGCHVGGTVIQFIMDVERLTFPEAVEFLANRVGMAMPEEVNDADMQRARAHRERLSEACRLAADFYSDTLLGEQGGAGRAYLDARGVTSDSVQRFHLGYAPDEWDALRRHLTQKGFADDELIDAGLLIKNPQTGNVYDAYRGRLIFPIVAAGERVIGFGARTLKPDEKPKYINTGDTPLYNKRRSLYGINLQKSGKLSDLVIVEGYTDVIGLYEAGVTNAVASLGTALTVQQARLLKRYVGAVYIAYDGDAAGQNATLRGLDILTAEGLNVRVIVFPNGQDPDEFVRAHGKEAFDHLKNEALTLNEFKLLSMARGYALENENEREQYAMAACRFIRTLSPIEQERYYQQLSRTTGYSVSALRAQGASAGSTEWVGQRAYTGGIPHERRRSERSWSERERAEATLLAAMTHAEQAADLARANGGAALFQSDAYRRFATALIDAYAAGKKPAVAAIVAEMDKEGAERIGEALREELERPEPIKAAQDCIRCMARCDLSEQIEQIKQSLADPALTSEEKTERLKHMQELNQRMRGL